MTTAPSSSLALHGGTPAISQPWPPLKRWGAPEAEQLQQIQQERLSSLQGRMVAAAMKANTHSGDNPALAQALQRFQDMGQSFTTE